MVTTEYELALTAVETECEKPEFNAGSFSVLIDRINVQPDLLTADWRELVRSQFRLTFDQDQSLVNVSQERVREIQSCLTDFGREIGRGATINGAIIKLPIEEQTPAAVHGILLELRILDPRVQTSHVVKMLRIAHCDANCRNWQWDSW